MANTRWAKYNNYSGIVLYGITPVAQLIGEDRFSHMHRAFYLTTQLEAPAWGTVQSYDGAGISGGPFHWIANYPGQTKQGSIFNLVRAIQAGIGINTNLTALLDALTAHGYFLGKDGWLHSQKTGAIVTGPEIRNLVAPVNGVVPETGPYRDTADKWALLFHNLFADPTTFNIQTEFAISYLITGYQDLERQAYEQLLAKCIESIEIITAGKGDDLSFEADLALCFYHSCSVNAPGIASRCLKDVLSALEPKLLIRTLGTKHYGQWHDTPDGENSRYDRARLKAKQSGLWPDQLFAVDGVMPKNLVDV